ncbi:hypothetical protein ZWY2020_003918 [Hordeum vulgare]|nr:hypothetical protein ZWY2020_003918 [Hordeum vulgare]
MFARPNARSPPSSSTAPRRYSWCHRAAPPPKLRASSRRRLYRPADRLLPLVLPLSLSPRQPSTSSLLPHQDLKMEGAPFLPSSRFAGSGGGTARAYSSSGESPVSFVCLDRDSFVCLAQSKPRVAAESVHSPLSSHPAPLARPPAHPPPSAAR